MKIHIQENEKITILNPAIAVKNDVLYSECSYEASKSFSRLCLSSCLNLSARLLPLVSSVKILVSIRITCCLRKQPFPELNCLCCSISLKNLPPSGLELVSWTSSMCSPNWSRYGCQFYAHVVSISKIWPNSRPHQILLINFFHKMRAHPERLCIILYLDRSKASSWRPTSAQKHNKNS